MFSHSRISVNLLHNYCRRVCGAKNVFRNTVSTGSRAPAADLYDTFGRKHNYLRISLTERCNLRCLYCMPEEGIELTANDQLLTTDEIKQISGLFVKTLGVTKIRLTGGEPLIRKDIIDIIRHLSELRPFGLKTIGLTTNGIVLDRMCSDLKLAGLNAINISLDTLRADKYELITRRKGYRLVMKAIDRALSTGFDSIKLNCVVIKGFNESEIPAFVELTRDSPLDVRFIEYMPFDGNRWASQKMVTYQEMLAIIRDVYPGIRQLEPKLNETAKAYKVDEFKGQLGFITSMSDNFCGTCNRIRITADGNLKVCLFGREEVSLRDAIRMGVDETQLVALIRDALNRKHRQHAGALEIAKTPNRPMIRIAPHPWPLQHRLQVRQYSTGTTDDQFTHLDQRTGDPKMVDISGKPVSVRIACAVGRVWVGAPVCQLIRDNAVKKGNVLTVAQIAGIIATKQTSKLIPLCHQINLEDVSIDMRVDVDNEEVVIESRVKTRYGTGVEMEALTAVSVAALTVYDMCKSVNNRIVIKEIRLVAKSGGKRDFHL